MYLITVLRSLQPILPCYNSYALLCHVGLLLALDHVWCLKHKHKPGCGVDCVAQLAAGADVSPVALECRIMIVRLMDKVLRGLCPAFVT